MRGGIWERQNTFVEPFSTVSWRNPRHRSPGKTMRLIPQSPEELAFAREDLRAGCQEGIYEEVSRVEVEEIRSTGAIVSSSFVVWQEGAEGCKGRFVVEPFQAIQTLAERECKDGDLAGVRTGARAWRPHGVIRYQGWVPALSTGAKNAQLVPIPLRGLVLPLCRPSIWLGSQPDVVHTAYGPIGMPTAYRAWISFSSIPRRLSSLSGKGGKSGDETRLWPGSPSNRQAIGNSWLD
jgi:hypothetical protein